jgi:putative peptidoglycan lipid II flippase
MVMAARREGMTLRPSRPRLSPNVRRLFVLILPAAIGAGVAQINLLADVFFASLLPTGAVSFLYYADRVNQLPLGVIGVAVGTALLPLLSRQIRAGDAAGALSSQNRALELALLLTVPAALALIVTSTPIVRVLFERGAFGAAETAATAAALAAYAVGLPAYVLGKVLTPGFFARQDTKTPVKIAVASLITNIALNLALIGPLGHVGIALATALSNWLNAALLFRGLRGGGLLEIDARLRRRLPRILAAALVMALGLWVLIPYLGALLPDTLALAALIGAGGLGFVALAHLGGATDLREIGAMLSRAGRRRA